MHGCAQALEDKTKKHRKGAFEVESERIELSSKQATKELSTRLVFY